MLLASGAPVLGCSGGEIPLPPSQANGTDIFLRSETQTIEDVVPPGATLARIFERHAMGRAEVHDLVEIVRPAFNPRRLRVGHQYTVVLDDDGRMRRFEYHIDNDRYLRVAHVDGPLARYDAEVLAYEKDPVETIVRGRIDARNSSLVAALNASGERIPLAIRMAGIFSGEIDFNNDLRRGDHFDTLFQKYYREEAFAGYGDILAATFHNDGRTVQAFGFRVPGDDELQYFDADGRSLNRLFLRSPFRFEPRITSRFSYRRLHPILGVHRAHLGVDYGAPTGTPVVSVANGRVVSAGMNGGSGNMVRLRHTNGYETYYLHLSRFANGMRPGVRVVQGQTIGYVGSTGLSTGPHLDFRIRKGGNFVNPLLEHRNMPPGDPVPSAHREAFIAVRDRALARLSALRNAAS